MTEGDLDVKDFPKVKIFHWKKFWRLLGKAKTDGVTLQPNLAAAPAAAMSSGTSATPSGLQPKEASLGAFDDSQLDLCVQDLDDKNSLAAGTLLRCFDVDARATPSPQVSICRLTSTISPFVHLSNFDFCFRVCVCVCVCVRARHRASNAMIDMADSNLAEKNKKELSSTGRG